MNIAVNYKDTNGNIDNTSYSMSRLAFIKHLAIAGQGYAPHPSKILRTMGMLLHYSAYLNKNAFASGRFSEPPAVLSDPTEKGQFSNLAGKAIADFLSKKIDKSIFTVNYEAVMRFKGIKLKGARPDLIAYTQNSTFAIEAKGRHQSNPGNMLTHKNQSASGPVSVNFSVASIAYNLFNRVSCNYHDPFNDNVPFDEVTLSALTRRYYRGLSEFLNIGAFRNRSINIQGESFFEVDLLSRNYANYYLDGFLLDYLRPKLILPAAIHEYARNGLTGTTNPFTFEGQNDADSLYIDNDRVGLRVG